MNHRRTETTKRQAPNAVETLTDFVLFSHRSCMLRLSSSLNRGKISYPQFFLLAYLAEEDCLSMSNIARMMGHSTAAATGMIDKLQELGYLSRSVSASDRRKIMVRITRSGAELVEKMRSSIAEELASLMAQPDGEEKISTAASALRKTRVHA